MKCLILAGGSGDRLWPLSRKDFPKQFIKNEGQLSLFQETITRNIPFCDEFVVVTNWKYEDIVAGQLQQFQGIRYRIILEKNGNGTAGAISVATVVFKDNEEVLIVPSATIMGQEGYSDAIFKAKEIISGANRLCLFGTTATSPSTEYGYIQNDGVRVIRFLEKPSFELADKIFWRENTLWNCGMLMCNNATLKEQLTKYCNSTLNAISSAYDNSKLTESGSCMLGETDENRVSFERAVLEKSGKLVSVKITCDWKQVSDFKTYETLYGGSAEDAILNNCNDVSIINKKANQLIVANELENILVVNTADALYISRKDAAGDIKSIIDTEGVNRDYFLRTPVVYRPWGTRELIQEAEGYRVRRIEIYPGMQLSNHTHDKRNENYTVVKGILTVVLSHVSTDFCEGEIVNIRAGREHRLQNNTDDTIILIEVDTGSEISENDMVQAANNDDVIELPSLYKMHPAYKDYLWGGDTLVRKYGKDSNYEITAESWELSAHPDGPSQIVDGVFDGMPFDQFIRAYGDKVCGWKSKTFDRFPVLIKFIDARNALSVQIHPDDDYAFPVENEFGKNEMWYVMDAAPDSYLYCGLSKECTKEDIEERIANTTLTEVLNKIEVKPGDVIFVPAGTIHAIGQGILICEIQQNSNCTYRMYDYGRRDKNGNLRELHVAKAMDVVNVEPYMPELSGFSEAITTKYGSIERVLSRCKYFQVTYYKISENEIIQIDDSSFKSIVVLDGECKIRCGEECSVAKPGDSFFISAGRKRVHVEGQCEIIVTNI